MNAALRFPRLEITLKIRVLSCLFQFLNWRNSFLWPDSGTGRISNAIQSRSLLPAEAISTDADPANQSAIAEVIRNLDVGYSLF